MGNIEYVDDVFTIDRSGGNIILTWPSGRSRAMPIATFRKEVAAGVKFLAEFDASHGVVKIRANG